MEANFAEDLEFVPDEVARLLKIADEAHCQLARVDPSAFMTYVLRDEETNKPLFQSPLHTRLQRLASEHKRLVIWAHVEAGKTHQLSIGRALWELGKDPSLRIVVVSNTFGQAQKICFTIGKYIESSAEYHRVFPHIRKAAKGPWARNVLQIERPTRAKDPSVTTLGIHGNILGARIDLLILDDLLDYENTMSLTQRDDLWNWFQSTLETRLTRKARIWCVGTAWNADDFMHRVAQQKEWFYARFGVLDAEGHSTWPDRWPEDRIIEKRSVLGPVEFNRQLMCITRSDEESRFKLSWINACKERGNGKDLIYAFNAVPDGYRIYTGVDLSVGYSNSDLSALFTIAVHPDESRQIIDITSGRWKGPEIVERIIDTYNRYHGIIMVENNASQEFIAQFTRKMSAVPIKSFTTTGSRLRHPEFGLETLATEMYNVKWIIPNKDGICHPEVEAWINDLLYYDPKSHAGDRLMASWFAREAARQVKPKVKFGKFDTMSR